MESPRLLKCYSHYNEHRTDNYTRNATTENGVRNHGERFVDNHVGEEQSDEEQVTIFANGLDLSRIGLLLSVQKNVRLRS